MSLFKKLKSRPQSRVVLSSARLEELISWVYIDITALNTPLYTSPRDLDAFPTVSERLRYLLRSMRDLSRAAGLSEGLSGSDNVSPYFIRRTENHLFISRNV